MEVLDAKEFRSRYGSRRATGGKRAKDNGDEAESLILGICDAYRNAGRANLKKVDPPSRVVKGPGGPRIVYLANPFLDLVGAWTERGGRSVFLEVKSTSGHRLRIARDGGLTEKQIEALQEWRAAGAVTGVLWVHDGGLKVISLETIEHVVENRDASIAWANFPLCRRGAAALVPFDFLTEIAEA